jgi:hypothetical protein
MSSLIKQSRSIFIDSETNTSVDNTQVSVNLVPNDFYCGADEAMRMTLTTFEMRQNWYNLNFTNNVMYLFTPIAVGSIVGDYFQLRIQQGTYYDFLDGNYISDNVITTVALQGLAAAIQVALQTAAADLNAPLGFFPAGPANAGNTCVYDPVSRKFTIVIVQNAVTVTPLSFFISFQVPFVSQPLPLNNTGGVAIVQGDRIFLDTAEIMGGNSQDYIATATLPTIPLFPNPVVNALVNITFTTPYVAQLNTLEAVYLRSNLQTSNYSTYGFSQTIFQNAVQPSSIMARIPINNTYTKTASPFITFEDPDNLFFIEIGNKQLDQLTLYLTDDKNRFIPLVANGQVLNGQMSFKATIKWEVVVKDQANPFIPTISNLTTRLIAFPKMP